MDRSEPAAGRVETHRSSQPRLREPNEHAQVASDDLVLPAAQLALVRVGAAGCMAAYIVTVDARRKRACAMRYGFSGLLVLLHGIRTRLSAEDFILLLTAGLLAVICCWLRLRSLVYRYTGVAL